MLRLLAIRTSGNSVEAGPRTALGPPIVTPTAAQNGAGALTGTFYYAYSESDGVGQTTLSPAASVTVTTKTIRATVGMPRRGVSGQYLYRCDQGAALCDIATHASNYHLAHTFGGGYFQNVYDDNTADVSGGAGPELTDTTALNNLEVGPGVKFFRSHPNQGSSPADLTFLTADSGYTDGAYAADLYGTVMARTYYGNSFQSIKTGLNQLHFGAYWQDTVDDGVSPSLVWQIRPKGQTTISILGALSDSAAADSRANALRVTAALPSVTTADAVGVYFGIAGAGSTAQQQIGVQAVLTAGYTGTSASFSGQFENQSVNSGASVGLSGRATAASSGAFGVTGISSGTATKNIGVFGSSAGVTAAQLLANISWPGGVAGAALMSSNGGSTDDILMALDGYTPVFRVTDNGGFVAAGLAANSSTAYDFATSGKGNFRILANGNTNIQIGSTNNVPLLVNTNGTLAATFGTDQGLTLAGKFYMPQQTPASAGATCTTNQLAYDTGFVYVCTATNTWKRVAVAAW